MNDSKKLFEIRVKVDKPVVVGMNNKTGRRQLIPIVSGILQGEDVHGNILQGEVMPGGVDSQIIHEDGKCELSARYGIMLDNGLSFYIENNGIRTVDHVYAHKVFHGEFVDPDLYYFSTIPKFEVYSEELEWLEKFVFFCKAKRLEEEVIISFFLVLQ